jgi:carbohydrate-selective porin OprB
LAGIDRSLSGGLLLAGARWARPLDTAGVALARNGLSSAHRACLAAGGLSFFLGDGGLHYRPEDIAEAFYNVAINQHAHVGFDLQRIANPGYNRDRSPVALAAVRLHADF